MFVLKKERTYLTLEGMRVGGGGGGGGGNQFEPFPRFSLP